MPQPDCFADLFRVRRQFVPKSVEINALAALNQALDIGSAKIKVPGFGIANWSSQGPIPGSGASDRRGGVDQLFMNGSGTPGALWRKPRTMSYLIFRKQDSISKRRTNDN